MEKVDASAVSSVYSEASDPLACNGLSRLNDYNINVASRFFPSLRCQTGVFVLRVQARNVIIREQSLPLYHSSSNLFAIDSRRYCISTPWKNMEIWISQTFLSRILKSQGKIGEFSWNFIGLRRFFKNSLFCFHLVNNRQAKWIKRLKYIISVYLFLFIYINIYSISQQNIEYAVYNFLL